MIIRLNPDSPRHWGLYEHFEARCIDFGNRCGWPINQTLRQEIRRRFIDAPRMAGYYISEKGDAHLLSWVVAVYGEPGIQIYQAEGDRGVLLPLLAEFFEEKLPGWIAELEAVIQQPIRFVEYVTERPDEWKRAIRPYRNQVAERTMTIIRLAPHKE